MTTLQNNAATKIDGSFSALSIAHPIARKITTPEANVVQQDWNKILGDQPILHLLRPDFYLIFSFSPFRVLYQENIRLDLGVNHVTYHLLSKYSKTDDLEHMQRIDGVVEQFTRECRIKPLDFICKILSNIECPNDSLKRLMRTTFVAKCDDRGNAEYGVMCYHDVTALVNSIKPYNYDITFTPAKTDLCHEAYRRIRNIIPKTNSVTQRELEILSSLDRGLSSKETGALLFISKTTVDTHRQNMLRKWKLPNTAALLRKSKEEGWL